MAKYNQGARVSKKWFPVPVGKWEKDYSLHLSLAAMAAHFPSHLPDPQGFLA